MRAILATRCGAQQTYTVSYPPPPAIVLPLQPSGRWGTFSFSPENSPGVPPSPTNVLQTRKFKLSPETRMSPIETAYYAEV